MTRYVDMHNERQQHRDAQNQRHRDRDTVWGRPGAIVLLAQTKCEQIATLVQTQSRQPTCIHLGFAPDDIANEEEAQELR